MARIDISYSRITRVTTPVLLGQLSYTAMGVLDTIMVGRLGVTALAGVGLGNIVAWWILAAFWGMLAGVNTQVAQAVGAERPRDAGVSLWQGLYLGAGCAVVMIGLWPVTPWIFALTGVPEEVQAIATSYARIRLVGGAGLMALMVADNFYRGLGRTDVPMWFGFAKLAVNCGFNYVFIFGAWGAPRLGTDGAAVGTVIANLTIGAAMLALLFVKAEFREPWGLWTNRGFDRRAFRELVALSLPIGLQTFMEMGGMSAFTAIVGRLGEPQLAATNAAIQAWSLAFMAGFSLSVGATTLVGQCVGAGDPERAREAVRRVLRIGYGMMGLLALLYLGAPEWLMGLFVESGSAEALRPYARPVFAIVAFCLFLDLNFMVAWGALRGAGDTTFSMLVNVGSSWLVLVPATAVMAPRFGIVGAWSSLILHLALMGAVLRWRWAGDGWRRPPREEDEPPSPGHRPEPVLPEAA